jgi:branched-chain amino acid transport system substrate-binding protein
MYEEQYYKTLGKLSDYPISNVPWYNPKAALTGVVDKAFTKRFPKEKLMFHALNVGFTFEAMLIAADAYKRAGSAASQPLTDAIRQTDIKSRMMLGGPIKFDAKGQVQGILSAAVQNLNQRPTVVLPAANAEATPVFPWPTYKRS